MLVPHLQAALQRARFEKLEDESGYYGEIPDCPGVWTQAPTLEACRASLADVLEDWALVRESRNLPVPCERTGWVDEIRTRVAAIENGDVSLENWPVTRDRLLEVQAPRTRIVTEV